MSTMCIILFILLFLCLLFVFIFFFFSSRRRHTRCGRDWSSDVCSSDLFSFYSQVMAGVEEVLIPHNYGLFFRTITGKTKEDVEVINELIKDEKTAGLIRSEERRVGKECRT